MMRAKKARVKVSAVVARETHAQLQELAEQGKTTIGMIVAAAIPYYLRDAAKDLSMIEALTRDQRRVEARA